MSDKHDTENGRANDSEHGDRRERIAAASIVIRGASLSTSFTVGYRNVLVGLADALDSDPLRFVGVDLLARYGPTEAVIRRRPGSAPFRSMLLLAPIAITWSSMAYSLGKWDDTEQDFLGFWIDEDLGLVNAAYVTVGIVVAAMIAGLFAGRPSRVSSALVAALMDVSLALPPADDSSSRNDTRAAAASLLEASRTITAAAQTLRDATTNLSIDAASLAQWESTARELAIQLEAFPRSMQGIPEATAGLRAALPRVVEAVDSVREVGDSLKAGFDNEAERLINIARSVAATLDELGLTARNVSMATAELRGEALASAFDTGHLKERRGRRG